MILSSNKQIDEARQGEALITKGQGTRKLFLESYGCAMNFSDSEIVASILDGAGYSTTRNFEEADLILVNTCAIRDNAEQRVRGRLRDFNAVKKKNPGLIIGVLGCMAERLKSNLLEEEKIVDLVVGPDAYRDLPNLLQTVGEGHKAVNVLLSREETYADISPVRLDTNGVTAFISIMRGCDNMCSFCVVPYTRGRERSRDPESITQEARELFEKGYREVTLLGQNVDSYLWNSGKAKKEMSEEEKQSGFTFAMLLEKVAGVSPDLRVRFSTSNPKDMLDDVLHAIAKHENICKYIHLPVQSGNTGMLERMNRGYSREFYMDRIAAIRRIVPEAGISTDIITGFCGETDEEFKDTLRVMEDVRYDFAYMFFYSERPGTYAQKKYSDDIPEELKKSRLAEVIKLQQKHSAERVREGLGKIHRVLVERVSKRSEEMMSGRNSQNTVVVFPRGELKIGDYVNVLATECTLATLIGKVV